MYWKEFRKLLHQNAEISFHEEKTRKLLMKELSTHTGKVIELKDSLSFLVFYDFYQKTTVMIRAEMDGLKTSKGVKHACGHDGHMTILCALSKKLSEMNALNVNVLLVFQSAEETGAGASRVIESEEFLRICPDKAIALHVMPNLSFGTLWTKTGVIASGGKEVDVFFTGEAMHCATGLKEKDALYKGVQFLHDLYQQSFKHGMISMNVFSSGTVRNQISDLCEISGTMRYLGGRTEKQMIHWIESIPDIHCVFSDGYPVLRCSDVMVQCAVHSGANLLKNSYWICDDFAFYAQRIPSVYVLMGMESSVDLHHPDFEFNDELIEIGVQFLLKMLNF